MQKILLGLLTVFVISVAVTPVQAASVKTVQRAILGLEKAGAFLWKNKGTITTTAVVTAAVTHPEQVANAATSVATTAANTATSAITRAITHLALPVIGLAVIGVACWFVFRYIKRQYLVPLLLVAVLCFTNVASAGTIGVSAVPSFWTVFNLLVLVLTVFSFF